MTDRGLWVTGKGFGLNVRRLMYQTLIWSAVLGHDARSLSAALDSEDVERPADALVDGVRRDFELGGDFFRRKMLVDEAQAIELAGAEARDPAGHIVVGATGPPSGSWHARSFLTG